MDMSLSLCQFAASRGFYIIIGTRSVFSFRTTDAADIILQVARSKSAACDDNRHMLHQPQNVALDLHKLNYVKIFILIRSVPGGSATHNLQS